MLKTTTWSPDTCGCVLEYTWDSATSEAARVHTFKALVKRCQAHGGPASLADADVYAAVVAENQTKNLLLAAALAAVPRLNNPGGPPHPVPPVQYAWSFSGQDGSRALAAQFAGAALTAAEIVAIQAQAGTLPKPFSVS